MDLSFLQTYCIPVIVGICLCVGYVIKNSLTLVQNKYIPLIMAILGLILNVWINKGISPDIEVKLTEADVKNHNDVQLITAKKILTKMIQQETTTALSK